MKKFLALMAILLFSNLLTNKLFTCRNFSYKKIEHRNFHYRNFSGANFLHAYIYLCSFKKTKLNGANFSNAHMCSCYFRKADLSNANFSNAILWCVRNLEKAESVEGANFEGARYLSNKQKQFLRENGAINVPEDDKTGEELFEDLLEKIIIISKTISNGSKVTYDWLRRNGHKVLYLLTPVY